MKKFVSLFLITTIIITAFAIPTYANSSLTLDETDLTIIPPTNNIKRPLKESYTREELYSLLSGDHNFDIPEDGLLFCPENFPLEESGDVSTMDYVDYSFNGTYYIIDVNDAKLIIPLISEFLYKESYSDETYKKWNFYTVNSSTFVIRTADNPEMCLQAYVDSSGNLKAGIRPYVVGDSSFHWGFVVVSGGCYLMSKSGNSQLNGKRFNYAGNAGNLHSTSYTKLTYVLNNNIPTTIILNDYYSVPYGGNQYLSVSGINQNISLLGSSWITYSTASSSISPVSNNYLAGNTIGSTTVTATHRVTGATTTVPVYVGYKTNIRVYYDNAFVEFCEHMYYDEDIFSSSGPIANINSWMNIVKLKYARDFNIHINITSYPTFNSYPEQLDSNGNTICSNGNNYNAGCTCSTRCENSSQGNLKTYHHKNIYNILNRIPNADTTNRLDLYFTGHVVCYSNNTSCAGYYGKLKGLSNPQRGVSIIAPNFSGCTVSAVAAVIVHEIGHLFEVGDHETSGTNDCLWGANKVNPSVQQALTVCNTCNNIVKSNADKYNHD